MVVIHRTVCDECGRDALCRQQVVDMVEPLPVKHVADVNQAWRMYKAGSSVATGSVSKREPLDKSAYEVKCNCMTVFGMSSVMRIIRSEFRDELERKFGGKMTLPLLFNLPTEVVAWENARLVCVQKEDGQLMLSDSGATLFDVVRRMAMFGQFKDRVPLAMDDVLIGFSYLYLLKRSVRAIAAAEFGSAATIRKVFSALPMNAFDWDSFATLVVDDKTDGRYEISRAIGVPLVPYLASELGRVFPNNVKSVVKGVAVTTETLCVQILPAVEDVEAGLRRRSFPEVALADGHTFLPLGRVILSGYKKALTIEPGIDVMLTDGTVIRSPPMGIALFINGSVCVTLMDPGGDLPVAVSPFNVTDVVEYHVASVCDSYEDCFDLSKWYKKRFDPMSAVARFLVKCASFMLLQTPTLNTVGVMGAVKLSLSDGADTEGVLRSRIILPEVSAGTTYQYASGLAAFGLIDVGSLDCEFIRVNGYVELSDSAVVGSVCGLSVQLGEIECSKLAWADIDVFAKGTMSLDLFTMDMEAFQLQDADGPVDSFYDETATSLVDGCLPSITEFPYYFENPDELYAKFSYTRIVNDPVAVVRALGHYATLAELLRIDRYLIDMRSVRATGLRCDDGRYTVVPYMHAQLSWYDCAFALRYWHGWKPSRGSCDYTFASMLLEMYPVMDKIPVLRADSYLA